MGHSMGGLAVMEFTKRYASLDIQQIVDRVIIVDIPASAPKIKDPSNQTGEMLKKMLEIDLTQPPK